MSPYLRKRVILSSWCSRFHSLEVPFDVGRAARRSSEASCIKARFSRGSQRALI
uniref:Uncharacterized protein n=1 Tax=Utricularia reniformis TaxID=192314 RepID=A0A1Y0AZP6_9LAMI|nr:hypothetical protein AEK19_MT0348 [Utricularia reniformis]YP_009382735.1 hypothetical protein AEK19_MT2302 [Utricularia reniformis]ART30620.1 hypothetical protein AEK19_MT0348 [Utricularia reniformis]ART32445.1 hypothetical protein AEK19_MT2302 [Utricularia reniformis]